MKILDAGHSYELDSIDGGSSQTLSFVKREGSNFPCNKGSYPGTNCQEVLRVLIDRCKYLNMQKPCAETQAIIGNLESAILLFELRAAKNHNRFLNLETVSKLISGPTCKTCGHYGCTHHYAKIEHIDFEKEKAEMTQEYYDNLYGEETTC